MTEIELRRVRVSLLDGYTVTRFADGSELCAEHALQPGQQETADAYGIAAERLNLDHDVMHSILAHWIGLPASPALRAAATGDQLDPDLAAREESAVLALQAFIGALGISVLDVAKRLGQ